MKEMSTYNFYKYYQTNSNIRVIDVREPHEYDKYHIKNTMNIPLDLLTEKHFLFINKNHHYFIICKDGSKSLTASKYLDDLGYRVTYIVGGINRWPGELTRSRYSA